MSRRKNLKALIIGDNKANASKLAELLDATTVAAVTTISKTRDDIARAGLDNNADCAFVLTGASAEVSALALGADQAGIDLPIIAVVDSDDLHAGAALLRHGACDYLCAPALDAATIDRAVARVVALCSAVVERSEPSEHERLATSHATLERWAAELEIANARLREVDDLKTKFLSEVSHEIRTPLAAVVSAAKIITKHHQSKPEVVERFGQTILSEGERLTRLINEFLDLTKIEAGCVDWKDEEIDPSVVCSDVIGGLSALSMEKEINLVLDVPEGTGSCVADHDRVIQVLTNLGNNAIKYTPREGRIAIRAFDCEDTIRFEVQDSGPGIPADELDMVFDRFHQVRNTKAVDGAPRGTGLGLCICREIVDHYGGKIWVESEEGCGSTFVFTIPSIKARPIKTKLQASGERALPAHAARVLALVGDDGLNARLAGIPTSVGIDCQTANTPDEAAELLQTWRADVAVIASAFVEEFGDELIERMQSLGVAHILVYSPEIGFAYVGALESSDTIAKSVDSIAPGASTVLVVEDDKEYRSLLEFQLRDAGYDVLTADNGRSGLEQIESESPDVVLLDIVMPVLDGMSVLERLTQQGIDIPVAVLTAMDDARVAVAARELGARGVFRKDSAEDAPYRTVIARIQRAFSAILPVSARASAQTLLG